MKIRNLTIEEFKEFSSSYELYSIYQTVEYAFAMQEEGFQTLIIGLVNKFEILGAGILLVKKKDGFNYAYAPHGFLIDYNDFKLLKGFTIKLKKYLKNKGIIAVKFNPLLIKKRRISNASIINKNYEMAFQNLKKLKYHHFGYNNYFESLLPRYWAVININNKRYNLFKNIKKEYRTKIRSAAKNQIKIHKENITELKHLYKLTKNKYPYNLNYYKALFKNFNNNLEFFSAKLDTKKYLEVVQTKYLKLEDNNQELNNLVLANPNNEKLINQKINSDTTLDNARKNLITATNFFNENIEGIVLATVLIGIYRDTVYLLIDGYDKQFKSFNAKHLLIWKLIEKYSKLGYKKFNLGGISNNELKNNKYKGLNEFKLNFGADIYEYAGDFEIITNNTLYLLYEKSKLFKKIIKK